jgi:hypothetical protein
MALVEGSRKGKAASRPRTCRSISNAIRYNHFSARSTPLLMTSYLRSWLPNSFFSGAQFA